MQLDQNAKRRVFPAVTTLLKAAARRPYNLATTERDRDTGRIVSRTGKRRTDTGTVRGERMAFEDSSGRTRYQDDAMPPVHPRMEIKEASRERTAMV